MAKKKKQIADDNFEAIESSLSRTEQFIESNQKTLTIILVVVLAVATIVMAYQKWYKAPLEEKAQEQIYIAQQYFEKDSFNLALNGDGDYPGFIEIIDDYGSTKAANISFYYAGISCMKLKQYDDAIDYLEKFNSKDKLLAPIALGNIGDAYAEKEDLNKAAEYYEKAVNNDNNKFTAPIFLMKLGRTYEILKKHKKALVAYEKIKTEYKGTQEERNIDKFITRAKLNLK